MKKIKNPLITFDVITLFPKMFPGYAASSLIGKAVAKGLISIQVNNLRDWAGDRRRTTDGRPYGGGPGMILKVDPIAKALFNLKTNNSWTVLLSPRGKRFNQETAQSLSKKKHLIFICGHYEGVDQRVSDYYVDEEISIGDYVLSGGEPAAIVLIDAVARLIPGFLGNNKALETESFNEGLLEFPQYTRPETYENHRVPEILTKGNHQEIKKWREGESQRLTQRDSLYPH